MNVRSTDKKQLILDATMELIAEQGLHDTPMSQISKRSKVSTGAIYNYFPSKEVLINHLYLDLKREMAQAVLEGYDIKASYKERFFLIWRNFFNYLIAKPTQMSFVEQCSTSPLITEESKEAMNRYFEPVTGFLQEGIDSRILKKMDIPLMGSLIFASILSTAKLQVWGPLDITEDHRDAAAQSSWDGVKAQ